MTDAAVAATATPVLSFWCYRCIFFLLLSALLPSSCFFSQYLLEIRFSDIILPSLSLLT